MFIVWELVKRVIADGGDPMSGADLQAALEKDPTFKTILGGSDTNVATLSLSTQDHSGSRPMSVNTVTNCQASKVADITKLKADEDPKTALVGK